MREFATRLVLSAAALLLPALATAHEGHDHDTAPATTGSALPRMSTASELFEMVTVLDGQELTIYLDYTDSNEPVGNASLSFDVDGATIATTPHGPGAFVATLPARPSGVLALTASIAAGGQADLLTGDLNVSEPAGVAAGTGHGHGISRDLLLAALAGAAGMLVIVLALTAVRRTRRRSPSSSHPGAST